MIDWGDPWCDVGEEYNMKTRVFYSHVLALRASLGLRNDKIFPFDYWLIRNQGIWDEPQDLYHGTISELLTYIKHYYEEALKKLKKRLEKVEDCFENNEILNYHRLDPANKDKKLGSSLWCHPWGDNQKFHRMIESSLTQIGYDFKFKWENKQK